MTADVMAVVAISLSRLIGRHRSKISALKQQRPPSERLTATIPSIEARSHPASESPLAAGEDDYLLVARLPVERVEHLLDTIIIIGINERVVEDHRRGPSIAGRINLSREGGHNVIKSLVARLEYDHKGLSFNENPFFWGLLAMDNERKCLDRRVLGHLSRQMMYADQHGIPPCLLVGFLHQIGKSPKELACALARIIANRGNASTNFRSLRLNQARHGNQCECDERPYPFAKDC